MSKLPAFQFYPGDWMKDPLVSMLTPQSRGIWVDLICAMHENNRSGEITGTEEQLARISRCTFEEFSQSLQEISSTKVGDVTFCNKNVTVINRRMKKEYKEKEAIRLRVKRFRKKVESNENVTPLSSSSSSTSVNNIKKEGDKWVSKPTEHFDLTTEEIHATKQYIFHLKHKTLSVNDIKNFWIAFQSRSFDGDQYYENRAKCIGHFKSWLNKTDFEIVITAETKEAIIPGNLKRLS